MTEKRKFSPYGSERFHQRIARGIARNTQDDPADKVQGIRIVSTEWPPPSAQKKNLGGRDALALCLSGRRLHFAVHRPPHYSAKMQRISEILQFPVIVERRRPLSVEPQPFEKFDFLLRHSTAE